MSPRNIFSCSLYASWFVFVPGASKFGAAAVMNCERFRQGSVSRWSWGNCCYGAPAAGAAVAGVATWLCTVHSEQEAIKTQGDCTIIGSRIADREGGTLGHA